MSVRSIVAFAFCAGFIFTACGEAELPLAEKSLSLAIHDITVIDPASRQVLPGMTVYIDGGHIHSVVPAAASSRPTAAQEIDGRGKFLIPGLLDVHVHMGVRKKLAEYSAPLFIANGVTGVRDMDADCWEPRGADSVCIDELRQFRDQIEAGEIVGPHLLSLSSPAIRGVMHRQSLPDGAASFFYPSTEAEGRKLAHYLKDRGVDFIKTYKSMPREAYFGMADEARKIDLEIAGHVPFSVSVAEAAKAGQRSIEHARALPYDCSDYGPVYRNQMSRLANLELGTEAPEEQTRLRRTIEEYNPARCQEMLKSLVDNDTYYVPTHETREMDARAGDSDYRQDSRLAYIDKALLHDAWIEDLNETAAVAPETKLLFERFYEHGLMITYLAHQAGVKVATGTDANDTMVFPGFSMHDELVHFAKAGLAPMDILRAATIVPAQLLGVSNQIGAIAPGMKADLVILHSNPLDNITNSRSIDGVIFNGLLYDRSRLDSLLSSSKINVLSSTGMSGQNQ